MCECAPMRSNRVISRTVTPPEDTPPSFSPDESFIPPDDIVIILLRSLLISSPLLLLLIEKEGGAGGGAGRGVWCAVVVEDCSNKTKREIINCCQTPPFSWGTQLVRYGLRNDFRREEDSSLFNVEE